jgi:putative ABC transport system ATP-binding protein
MTNGTLAGTAPSRSKPEYGDGALIVCDNVVRIYQVGEIEVQALQGLDLLVDPGEMIAIIGASGSGKSTLLNVLSGLDVPTAGRARVAGRDLLRMSAAERLDYRRRVVGFIWQQTSRNLLPSLTAAENVAMVMAIAGVVPRRQRAAKTDELLGLLGVGDRRDSRPDEMSGGEQQRTAIAAAIANSPKVLLADEPTGELDEATSASVLTAMQEVNREHGITTLIVTHDQAVSSHVRRTIQIRDGRTSSEVLRRTELDRHGREQNVVEEFAVLDRVGRLQLPDAFTSSLDLHDRVRLALDTDHVQVWPADSDRDRTLRDNDHDDEGEPA